jgi:hypothetical protein
VIACALAAAAGAGCTPMRSTIPPPYHIDGRALSAAELESHANRRCAEDSDGRPQPAHRFTTDGCSAWRDDGWRSCCIQHDVAYWCGARPRLEVDREFRDCVRRESSSGMARLMFTGVRLGGGRFVPFPWRFGYGHRWPHARPGTPELSETRAQTAPTAR